MLKRSIVPCAVAVLLSAALGAQVQALGQGASSAPPPSNPTVHFEGCAYPESALTAPRPVVVPAGSNQAFVLTDVKVIAGSVSEAEASKTVYTLARLDREGLRALYGKRVGVTGRVNAGPQRPNLEVVSLREISGGCPTLPKLP